MEIGESDDSVTPTMMGRVASFYYLKHATMAGFAAGLRAGMTAAEVGPGSAFRVQGSRTLG